VRHGEPDYVNDCLTEEGRRQAAACARRLEGEGISEIYASPCGRALQTASYTAERLKLPVTILDYMHEISWGGPGIPHDGHPWTLGDQMLEAGFDFHGRDWREHPWFDGNLVTEYYDKIAAEFDRFLAQRGYRHEGTRFYCSDGKDETLALFSHGGSGACVLSHLLALPFPYVCSVLPYDFTSIIVLSFAVAPDTYVFPRLELFNDCAHIHSKTRAPILQQTPDEPREQGSSAAACGNSTPTATVTGCSAW